jgi:hypothetical protein
MSIRHWAVTTILTSFAVATFAADSSAQIFAKTRSSAPARYVIADSVSTGIVEGLPDGDAHPSPSLVQLAAESSLWTPACEPPGPTRGLWGDCRRTGHGCSWQECIMGFRDGLGWVFTRPTCIRGFEPASNASAWDWVTQWMPRLGATSNGTSATSTSTTVWTTWSE